MPGRVLSRGHFAAGSRTPDAGHQTIHTVTRSVAFAATSVVALLGVSCGGEAGITLPPQVGDPAPAFAAPSLETGDSVSLASLRGRPLVLNLWATWCPPCREETPYLQSIYERFRDRGLQVVGVTVDSRTAAETARGFLRDVGATYPQLHDPSMRVADIFRVIGLPATYVLDSDGVLRFVGNRPVSEGDEAFESAVDAVLESTP